MDKSKLKVIMIGLGYIGLPTAALIAKNKINVLGIDVNDEVVKTINHGKIHIVEPELAGLVKNVIDSGTLKASTKITKADVFLIAVPTPFKGQHEPDISFVENATNNIIPFLEEGNLFIIESTSPVGTTDKMKDLIYSKRPELKNKINIAYCPERVLPGKVLFELENNDRVIGGIDEEASNKAAQFYSLFVNAELHKSNARTAEMCKLTENSARDVSIAFANELSMICDKAGINVWELITLANKHPRINILQPGTGVGGHCIAVDPWFIVSKFPNEAKIIRSAREINNYKSEWVLEKIKNSILEFVSEKGMKPTVALMGLAFKPDIDDLRESPALMIAKQLAQYDKANYHFVEPNLNGETKTVAGLANLTTTNDAVSNADIVVFLVAHREFIQLTKVDSKIELDFCGVRK
ncbi:MAG: UDP-N-acetyl-D-mannosamine dehydrogenase [Prolixibacteraceae bacterium]|jgi:UDP-N-acetyl-D-mannosaminuronic acid dehydrogenase|nr:UDP-N-acetyl-D-mannosamine dehydrogenase [Prolixibacteraceae bacterium]